MPPTSKVVYFPKDIVDAAERIGAKEGRSNRAQLEHWIRVGKSVLDHSHLANHRVKLALNGELAIEDLGELESLMLRAAIDSGIKTKLSEDAIRKVRDP